MRGRALPILLLPLAACAPTHEPVRAMPDMAAPEAPPPPPSWPPPPPDAWRAGGFVGPPILQSPTEAWSRMLPGPIIEPVTSDGERVYAVAEGRVYCFDLDGNALWNIRSLASGGVAVTDQGPVVGTETGMLVVLDPKNGATVRSVTGGGPVRGLAVQLPTSVAWVTVHGGIASTADWGREVALSAAGGVAADGDTLYVTTLEGELVAANKDGVLWQAALPAAAVEGPALDAEHVYVPISSSTGQPGGVLAFDRAGKEVWRHQTEFQPAGPLSVGRHVYVPDKDGHVYALDRATGERVWAAEGFGEFGAQPTVVEGQVYAGNGDGSLYRIDGDDGGAVWKVPLGASVTGDPVYVRGRLVVGLSNGRLVALSEGQ
ncbi:MAG: PQQ-binding-like beta-propeller repeat protein [Pseudomonadota bacterium]|nr:PQQ-binding-like beta-propeller repeat protein [Pseudomonadota bacterium]